MREIDGNALKLCEFQAKIFVGSLERVDCGSAIFVRRFMYSQYAKLMDDNAFIFESSSENDAYYEIEKEYGKTNYGKEKYSQEELYWMGYVYRYWCCTYQISSKRVIKIISPTELRKLYFPYHSLDVKTAIERILEALEIGQEDVIKKGVKILRKIINNT